MAKFKDLTGQRFGRLTVVGLDKKVKCGKRYRYYWDCICDCGNHKSVRTDCLTQKMVQSCGCLRDEKAAINVIKNHKHKMSRSRLWQIYECMKMRCSNPNDKRYDCYGGRGIKVCDEWKNNSSAFFDWALSHGYKDDLQIDRIDNNGDYEPSNCRFVTLQENCRNRSSNVLLKTPEGDYITMAEAAELAGMDYKTFYYKYRKYGIKRKDLK